MGWFGSRGLASVVLGLIDLKHQTSITLNSRIVLVMIVIVLPSVPAHGISANPGMQLYACKIADMGLEAPECN